MFTRPEVRAIIAVVAFVVGLPFHGSAQPIVAIQPETSTVFLAGRVGERITQNYTIVRSDPTVEAVDVYGLDLPAITISDRRLEFDGSDTVVFTIAYQPNAEESFSSTISVVARTSMMTTISFTHEVHGKAVGPGPRWVVLPEVLDFGVVSPFVENSKALHIANLLQEPVTLDLSGLGSAWTVLSGGQQVSRIQLPVGGSQTLEVDVDGRLLSILVVNRDTLILSGSRPPDPSGPASTALPVRAHRGDGPEVEVFPDTIRFERDPTTGVIADELIAIVNRSDESMLLTQVQITTNDGSVVVSPESTPPWLLDAGQESIVALRRLNSLSPITTGRLVVRGTWQGGGSTLPLGEIIIMYDESAAPRGPVPLLMHADSGRAGDVVNVTITTPTDLQPNVFSGTVTLTYNPSIMEPLAAVDPTADTVVDGMRTSTVTLSPEGLRSGNVVGRVPFRLLLGNTASDTVIAGQFHWTDRNGQQTNMATISEGTRVVVTDARGYEINSISGPLTLAVSPHPVTETITIQYNTPPGPARIIVVDELARQVPGLSLLVAGGQSTATLSADMMTPGLYAVVLTSGVHSFVHLFVKE